MAEPSKQELRWLLDEKYNGQRTEAFEEDVARLRQGEPLDYVIGFSPFLGCRIDLSARPLIPRAETEYWVEQALQEMPPDKPLRVLDLFSGSGCVGVAVAKRRPLTSVTCAELDEKLIPQIQTNAQGNEVTERLQAVKSDVFSTVSGTYNFILANPPYIAPQADDVDASVQEWEPQGALYAQDGGLELIKRTIAQAPYFLAPEGVLYIEHDGRQSEAITAYARQFPYRSVQTKKDQYGKERFTRLQT